MDTGATAPFLVWIAAGLLVLGLTMLAIAGLLLAAGGHRDPGPASAPEPVRRTTSDHVPTGGVR